MSKRPRLAHPAAAPVRCGDLVEDKRIRFLTEERADGFPYVFVSNVIWQTIVQFFDNHPNANLMTDKMIIEQTGRLVLPVAGLPPDQPFLTRKLIQQYFTHSFTFQETDQTLTVRLRMMQNKPVWLVFVPDWLRLQWQKAGRPTP